MESLIAAIAVGVIVGGVSSWLSHQFEREQRRELRLEERDRDLRQMLETLMRFARTTSSGLTEYELATIAGRDIQEAVMNQHRYIRDFQSRNPDFFWRPHRIKDEPLRGLATELQNANSQAAVLMGYRVDGLYSSIDDWRKQVSSARSRIDDVLKSWIIVSTNWNGDRSQFGCQRSPAAPRIA
jgi:hypothetical protein